MIKSLKLHKGREESVLRRHPWIFSRAIQSSIEGIEDGDLVRVLDHRGNVLGIGHYQNSSLSIRLLAFDDIEMNEKFWSDRFEAAAKYRIDLNIIKPGYTDAFRLIHAEGDQLPGLIIDVYKDVAVLQAHSIGMHLVRHDIAQAIMQMSSLQMNAVYCKSHEALPTTYAVGKEDEWLAGTANDDIIIAEGGIKFHIDVVSGQKTGFFLDQRENRELIRRYSTNASVLNCFSYSGGFSMYALDGGAKDVTSVDTSAGALAMLDKNLELNSFNAQHQNIRENVMTFLTASEKQYDIVIVDPPAFAKNLSKRHNAIQAYKRLNMLAIARVKKGGMLFTYSCSQVVDKPMFHNTIVAAAIESGRPARIIHEMSQGPDHPVSVFHPEGQYLKGLALYMD